QGGHNRGWSYDGRLGLHKMLQTDIQAGAIHGNGPLATTMRGTVIGDQEQQLRAGETATPEQRQYDQYCQGRSGERPHIETIYYHSSGKIKDYLLQIGLVNEPFPATSHAANRADFQPF